MARNLGRRGATVATVLMVVAVAALAAFTLAGGSLFNTSFSRKAVNLQAARYRAEAVVHKAIQKVISTQTGNFTGVVTLDEPGPFLGKAAIVTFDPAQAASLGVGFSTNNVGKETTPGAYRRVRMPADSLHVVGTGECNGARVVIEALIHFPRFPYSVASETNIRMRGTLIAGVNEGSPIPVPVDGSLSIEADDLAPGDIFANGTTMSITDRSLVTGDARSVGNVQVDDNSAVRGEIQNLADNTFIPKFDVAAMDPKEGAIPITGVSPDEPLEGFLRHEGSLTVPGDLTLAGGSLYVNGNLRVGGAVRGTGALMVNGTTELMGNVLLTGDDLVAVLSEGDVILEGGGRQVAMFQGLVSTKGRLVGRNITIMGTFIASGVPGATEVFLDQANLIHVPGFTKVDKVGLGGDGYSFSMTINKAAPGVMQLGQQKNPTVIGDVITFVIEVDPDGKFRVHQPVGSTEDGSQIGTLYNPGPPPDAFTGPTDARFLAFRDRMNTFFTAASWDDWNGQASRITDRIGGLVKGPQVYYQQLLVAGKNTLTIDPNNFISLADRARILLWRDIETE